ncbi:hypothetical protein 1 [Wuhan insect virus 20]|uniref:hypothetical protein 1 n=1 Tax=Wuhan insect virus 20 TaxID=1923724 RepID=UPI00090A1CB5|nr:hypothetical protein 1 [Wuhan insect virus 20]APG76541.1 hypothetical protein 1 [Wuhan insect virus 20]
MFDQLLTASVRVIRDFISFCYNKAGSIYCSLKKWLWDLQGKFQQYDAFVDLCYGFMDDVEEAEFERLQVYEDSLMEESLARKELSRILALPVAGCWPMPTRPPGSVNCEEYGYESALPADHQALIPEENVQAVKPVPLKLQPKTAVSQEERETAFLNFAAATAKFDQIKETIKDLYAEERGPTPFGRWFGTLKQRMATVKQAKIRRERSKVYAAKVEQEMAYKENIPELLALTICVEVDTGEPLPVKKDEQGAVRAGFSPGTKKVLMRQISSSPSDRKDAANWIRHYVRNKNRRLSSDEVSHATIQRYVEQICSDLKLDLSSTTFLLDKALMTVPVPTKRDLKSAMIVHSPAACSLRRELAVLNSSVF